jgi:hypothetical protein
MRRALLALPLVLALAVAAEAGPTRQCVDQSEALVGERARLLDKERPPRKLRSVPPDYPTRQGSSKALSSIWLGEALVAPDGHVRDVWTIRPLRFEPVWPEFEEAILASIRQSVYEPVVIDGKAVPICITISVLLHFE